MKKNKQKKKKKKKKRLLFKTHFPRQPSAMQLSLLLQRTFWQGSPGFKAGKQFTSEQLPHFGTQISLALHWLFGKSHGSFLHRASCLHPIIKARMCKKKEKNGYLKTDCSLIWKSAKAKFLTKYLLKVHAS